MGCDIHIRAEVREDGKWNAVGRVFDSPNRWHYFDTSRENLEALSDGQLLDALAYKGESEEQATAPRGDDGKPSEDYHKEFRERLSAPAREVFRLHNDRLSEDRAKERVIRDEWSAALEQWRKENPQDAEDAGGYIGDEHPVSHEKFVEPKVLKITRERRDAVKLGAEVRESIIAVASTYYPYEEGELDSVSFDLGEGEPPHKTEEPYDGRNYDLFALLANVRNGGHRGEPDRVEPISEPRGVPEDADPETAKWVESHGDHSHSYLSLRELHEVDWENGIVGQWGIVSEKQFEKLRPDPSDEANQPTTWSGGISGPGIRIFTPEGYDAWVEKERPWVPVVSSRHIFDPEPYITPELLEKLLDGRVPMRPPGDHPILGNTSKENPFESATGEGDAAVVVETHPNMVGTPAETIKPYIVARWGMPYPNAMGSFPKKTIPALEALGKERGVSDEDVRIVFSFDS